jgi:hypothetical protein
MFVSVLSKIVQKNQTSRPTATTWKKIARTTGSFHGAGRLGSVPSAFFAGVVSLRARNRPAAPRGGRTSFPLP